MNTIKKLSAVIVACVLAGFVQADALYWQVDTGTTEFDTAALYVSDGTFLDGAEALAGGTTTAPTLSDLGDYGSSAYSFYVELFNASGESLLKGQTVSYDDLLNSGYISTGGISTPNYTAALPYNGASVPEPTSGMLLLIGGALLALRRRRQA